MPQPQVTVLVLGGTITMSSSDNTQKQKGIIPKLRGEDLIKLIPDIEKKIALKVHTPFLKPGPSIEPMDILHIAQKINDDRYSVGTVIVQGTDTIDETSYLLDLLCAKHQAVVVTGAMRGADALSADGPANLAASILIAANPTARQMGTLVCLNDEIHTARDVQKSHKFLLSSFESLQSGPVGYFYEGNVHFIREFSPFKEPLRPQHFAKVAIIKIGIGSEDDLINSLHQLKYKGAVIEAAGVGHLQAKIVDALDNLVEKMPVLLSSRVNKGPIFNNTYGFAGSEIDLLKKGLLSAHWLSSTKARLLLSVLIGAGIKNSQLHDYLEHYGQA